MKIDKEKQEVLTSVLNLLKTIGSANDAEDHGFIYDAERMRTQSCQALHDLLLENEFISLSLPTLREELESKRILWVGWAELYSIVEGKIKRNEED